MIRFWEDVWAACAPLKVRFPRIFALAVKKEGKIEDFGCMENSNWRWNIALRRNLFDWEIPLWEEFTRAINSVKPGRFKQGSVRWKGDSNGVYSSKGYCRLMDKTCEPREQIWDMVWAKLAPPKVESFTWRIVHERILTKSELAKRGMMTNSSPLCVLCGNAIETPNHLFCECGFSWSLWQKWCNVWQVNLVMPRKPKQLLVWWCDFQPGMKETKVWKLSFFCMVWTIWLGRNEVVFKKKFITVNGLFDLMVLRLAWWCKAKWPNCLCSISEACRMPEIFTAIKVKETKVIISCWCPPSEGYLKFNVDGAAAGSFGAADIGGILCGSDSKVLMMFSKNVGCLDAATAEILAIVEALKLYRSSKWAKKEHVLIESDSSEVVKWFLNPLLAPGCFRMIIEPSVIEAAALKWSIKAIARELNSSADKLAKKGINRRTDFVWSVEEPNPRPCDEVPEEWSEMC